MQTIIRGQDYKLMILKEHELHQIDEKFICRLREQDPDALVGLSIKLASDLKEAMERLNQNPSNSSRPSGSLAPWDKGITGDEDDEPTLDENEVLRLETGLDKEDLSEVCIAFSSPTCPVRVSFEDYTTLSTPSPCDRLSRLRVI